MSSSSRKRGRGEPSEPGTSSSCHQCKSRRKLSTLHYCTNPTNVHGKPCIKKYCDRCLEPGKFYEAAAPKPGEDDTWQCPACRGVCTCALCVSKDPKKAKKAKRKIERQLNPLEASAMNIINGGGFASGGGLGAVVGLGLGGLGGAVVAEGVEAGEATATFGDPARSLLWEVSRDEYIQRKIFHFANTRDLNEQEKVNAMTSLLNQAVFPPPGGLASWNPPPN